MFKLFKVKGNSMLPTLSEGDILLIQTLFWRVKLNQVVLCKHANYGTIVKRVRQKNPEGLRLMGDNPNEGISEDEIGLISKTQLIGVMRLHIKQPQKP